MDGFDAALARYRAFLAHDPITPLLRRSLALLVPGNIRVDTVTADDRLRCTTDGTAVTVGGAEYLLRTDFDARHWTAALRVLLAREIQHDSSCMSPARVLPDSTPGSGRGWPSGMPA